MYAFCMALNIKDTETDRLVRSLAAATGETITEAVATAVRERLDRVAGARRGMDLVAEMNAIAERCSALPVLDDRPSDEILGYDANGLPT
jgi:antitoxin VapB